jgi:hypothetical protein
MSETDRLMLKYQNVVKMIDYDNMLVYGALFRQLFKAFEPDKLNKSIEDLANLLQRACVKLSCQISTMHMEQLYKLYSVLMNKFKESGCTALRPYNADIMRPLMYRMYYPREMGELLAQLEAQGIEPAAIVCVNAQEDIVYKNKSNGSIATFKLPPSGKHDELKTLLEKV